MGSQLIDQTLALLQQAQARFGAGSYGSGVALKDMTTQLGYVWYDLQPVASQLFPVITPLRNKIPRVPGNGGTATHWKAIMGINVTRVSPGVSEGHRNAFNVTAEQDFSVPYATLGHDDFVSEQARQANGALTPAIDALNVQDLLLSVMIDEEFVILNGYRSMSLATPSAPTITLVTNAELAALTQTQLAQFGLSGTPVGALSGGYVGAMYCYVVALTPDGLNRASISGGLVGQITRKNADGSEDVLNPGTSQVSPVSGNTVTTTTGSLAVSCYVPAVEGAAAYAWFLGPTGAANAVLAAITTTNYAVILANPAGSQVANDAKISGNYSTDGLIFDGVISLALQLNGLYAPQPNLGSTQATGGQLALSSTPLTADGTGGIMEINTDLLYWWNNWRLSPTEFLVSAQELTNITNKVIGGGGAPLFRFLMDTKGGANGVVAGAVVGSYLNKVGMGGTGVEIPVRLHPNVTPGTIVYWTDKLPYPLVNVKNITQMRVRREFREVDWPVVTNRQEYGVYVDEALEMRGAFAYGVRSNIANG